MLGFSTGIEPARRPREQFLGGNTKTIGEGCKPVGRDFPVRFVFDSTDITSRYFWSKPRALPGHSRLRKILLIASSANEVPEGVWTPICHFGGLQLNCNARTRQNRKLRDRQTTYLHPKTLVGPSTRPEKLPLPSGSTSFIIINAPDGEQCATHRN